MHESFYTIPACPGSIALLSDLHNADYRAIVTSVEKQKVDMICVTGDVLYGSRPEGNQSPLETQTNVLPFLTACASLAPTFLSLGNHEWMLDDEDLATIASTGVIVLDNSFTTITVDKREVFIAGLTSGYVTDYRAFRATVSDGTRYPKKESISGIGGAVTVNEHKPETEWLRDFATQPGLRVVLSHHPEYYPLIPSPVDLVLSGHAHGGQIRIFNHGLWSPGQALFPRWTRGVYENRLVVSTGLSNTTWVPRLFNPTEVVYITSG